MNIEELAEYHANHVVENEGEIFFTFTKETLQRFFESVAAQEAAKWDAQTNVEIHEAVLEEREACADLCYQLVDNSRETRFSTAIRARENT